MKVYIGSDHAGFDLKEFLKKELIKLNIAFVDLGPAKLDLNDDYPVYAELVARAVVKSKGVGILICGNAQGICIASNKIKGVRAAVCYDEFTAKTSREHDDANIICLRGRNFSKSKNLKILKLWLSTPFSGESRHVRRLNQLKKLEKNG